MKYPEESDEPEDFLKLLAEYDSGSGRRFRNLEEAKQYSDSYAVFEGDFGGVIYALVPVSLIKCNEKEMNAVMNLFLAYEFGDFPEEKWEGYTNDYVNDSIEWINESYYSGKYLQEKKWIMDTTIN